MNLDIFNNLVNNLKENDFVQNFVKELGEYLEKGVANKMENLGINEDSLLESFQKENNITSEYRDKMLIERGDILENYAQKTQDEGQMFYIYDKSNDNYLLSICEEAKSHQVLELTKEELPLGAEVDSILRMQDGKYVLDENATEAIKEEVNIKFNELLQEQSQKMDERRVEGHTYEFVESSVNSIWLIDNDANNGEVFEEFDFQKNVFQNAKQGDLFQYREGTYKLRTNI